MTLSDLANVGETLGGVATEQQGQAKSLRAGLATLAFAGVVRRHIGGH